MRKNPTEGERCMWEWLKGGIGGFRFRRQVIIGNYIVDFACIKAKIIIEIDGGYHNTEEQINLDTTRTNYLNRYGYQVIRFTNEEIIGNPTSAYERIKQLL